MEKWKKRMKLNNDGAAMVTVLIVCMFIIILASTLLYTSSMNYQMKGADYQNTKSFYKAEEALDTLKALMVKDVEEAYVKAYGAAIAEFADATGADAVKKRNKLFVETYIDALSEIWTDRAAAAGSYRGAVIALMNSKGVDSGLVDAINIASQKTEADADIGAMNVLSVKDDTEEQYYVVLENVTAFYTDEGFSSWITTDIAMMVPDIEDSILAVENSKPFAESEAIEYKPIHLDDSVIYMNWRRY